MKFLIKVLFCALSYSQVDIDAIWKDLMSNKSSKKVIDVMSSKSSTKIINSLSELKERLEDCKDTTTFSRFNKKIVVEIIENFMDGKLEETMDDLMDTCVMQTWVNIFTKEEVKGLIDIYNDRLPKMKEQLTQLKTIISMGNATGMLSFNIIKIFLSQTDRIKQVLESFESEYWSYFIEVTDKKGLHEKDPWKTSIALVEHILKEIKSSLEDPNQFGKDVESLVLGCFPNIDPLIKKVADTALDYKFPDHGLQPLAQKLVDYHEKFVDMDFVEDVILETEKQINKLPKDLREPVTKDLKEPVTPFNGTLTFSYIFSISFSLTL